MVIKLGLGATAFIAVSLFVLNVIHVTTHLI